MSDTEKKIRPFSCGSQFADWSAANCERCKIGYDDETQTFHCDIEKALGEALFGDGSVTPEIAKRMGHEKGPPFPYNWECTERQPKE